MKKYASDNMNTSIGREGSLNDNTQPIMHAQACD